MACCLLFLTSINFVLYASSADKQAVASETKETKNNIPPSGPTEEKACGSGFSIAEEILHEAHPEFSFTAINQLYLHHIAESDKIEMFHPELILPPPKQS